MFTNRFPTLIAMSLMAAMVLATVLLGSARSAGVIAPQANQDRVLVTGMSDFPDYYHRHPELSAAATVSIDTTDYFFRHPELRLQARSIDLTDYYFRRAEISH